MLISITAFTIHQSEIVLLLLLRTSDEESGICTNMNPTESSLENNVLTGQCDQSEQRTIVPMDVDEQAEYKPEYVNSQVSQQQKEKDDIEAKYSQVCKLLKEKDDSEANCRKRIKALETELDERKAQVTTLQSEKEVSKTRPKQMIQNMETEIRNRKQQINILQSEKENLIKSFKKAEKKASDYSVYIGNQNAKIRKITLAKERDIEQYRKDMAQLLGEKIQIKNQLLSLEEECKEQKEKIESLEKQNKSLNSTLVSERKNWGEREHQMHHNFNVETDKLKESLKNAVQEIDDLTIRLSKLASASLTHNNPNIADLSDPNRPTKLAEAFSELYDNEWTDAFEKLKDDDEVKTVKHLLTMLQKAFGFSVSLSEQALVDIKGTSTKIVFTIKKHQPERMHVGFVSGPNSSEQNNVNGNVSDASSINGPDEKATSPIENCENEITVKTIIGPVNTMKIQDTDNRMTTSQQNPLNKETQHDTLSGKLQDDGSKNDAQPTTRPVSAMNEKLLVHGNHKFQRHGVCSSGMDIVKRVESKTDIATVTFDFEKLQPTEKQLIGDIRKRVLNEIKGQIISMISHAVVAEMNLDDCENSIFTYVKACASICWEMRIHQPPVCLEFVEVDDQTPLNTATYKHYTKSGPRMDYVVWPALYLYKGGPLLSKGVAQGK
ncbi:putative leucine-rich repeat-containing protein DDB_G0290503 isoform X1 [Dreissena polymorpha]|uniref:putative leucine-rich repeat-containing protein DDB_G0290503 isoform X1 n=1 Tax=Dreissena polymorpha TaxID=45954 RepID=UPI002264574A|nr:putative leucine-rich repeat-containing protein DDB_G0290503 isoform X1 [Dreissena polymorpha]